MAGLSVALVGATGAVGSRVLNLLEQRRFPLRELRLYATARSAGREVDFGGTKLRVEEYRPDAFAGTDLAFLAVPGASRSRELVSEARRRDCVVIDKGSAFRLDPEVPLVVPEVNASALARHKGLISSPNCSTIQLMVAIGPLKRTAGLKRIIAVTYQAASGAGQAGAEELRVGTAEVLAGRPCPHNVFARPLAFNVIPQIDRFDDQGYTLEEMKLVRESQKILDLPELPVSATAVRVPVFVGHAEAIYVETERRLAPAEVRGVLREAPGVVVVDDPAAGSYPTPLDAADRDEVFVGRVRADLDVPNGLHLWVVADNLRKGAATNAVQIAEILVREGLV